MRKSKKSERKTIILLVAVLLFMAVGFATYTTVLNIGGGASGTSSKATFKNAWNVHYMPDTLQQSGKTAQSATLTDTDFTFNVTLDKPGDTYTATWKVKNYGTINAKLTDINLNTLTDAQKNYVEYKLTYGTTDYTASTSGLSIALNSEAEVTVTLTLKYKENVPQTQLPTSDDVVTINGSLIYADVA